MTEGAVTQSPVGVRPWRLLRRPAVLIGLLLVLSAVLSAVFAPLLTPYDPVALNALDRLQGPSAAHPLGTDQYGRDNLARILYGGRTSLFVAGASILFATLVGGTLGLLAGYLRGAFDADPDEHVALYKQKLMTISVSKRDREAVMCKSFGTSLTGPRLTWFMHLQHGSISFFADLVNAFKIQFASSRKLEKQSSDLYHVIQRSNETLCEYLNRYNKEKVSTPHCDVPTSIQAFRRGLGRSSMPTSSESARRGSLRDQTLSW